MLTITIEGRLKIMKKNGQNKKERKKETIKFDNDATNSYEIRLISLLKMTIMLQFKS